MIIKIRMKKFKKEQPDLSFDEFGGEPQIGLGQTGKRARTQ